MEYIQKGDKIIIKNIDSFNIKEILECGQCFRFKELDYNYYKIIAYRKILYIRQIDDIVEFFPTNKEDFDSIWIDYFDLKTNYKEIKDKLQDDPILKKAIDFAPGIRILNQEPWECLISFIISQNNRIPMIKQVINNLSEKYGDMLEDEFIFPTLNQIKNTTLEELALCKTGFRNKYILDAIEKVKTQVIDFDKLLSKEISLQEAKENLMLIKGVGTKVADCILLFSLKKNECFPTDVWIKRVMEYFYFEGNETNIKKIHSFAQEKWDDLAGYAQQYLFYYARSEKIGVK